MSKAEANYRKLYIYFLSINCSLGYAYWAYNLSIFNSLQSYLESYVFPEASTTEMSLIASILSIGAIFGSIIASPAISRWGRRATMIGSDIFGIIGLILTIVPNMPSILIGRFISGVVGGINNVVIPVYLVEMSPLDMCGASGNMSNIVLEFFAFVSLALSYAVPREPDGGIKDQVWRILFFFPAVLNVIRLFFLTFVFKFDTPFQYIQKHKDEQARVALKKIFTKNLEPEYKRISLDVQSSTTEGTEKFRDLFTKKYRRNFFVSFLVALVQQFCGAPAVFVFSNEIFSATTDNPELFSLLLGVINLLSVFLSFIFIEKLGRRALMISGTFLIGVLLLTFGIIAQIDSNSPTLNYILLVWPVVFQSSIGSLVFLYVSEALPPVGVALCIAANWVSGFLISQFYLQSVEAFGVAAPFLFFAIFCLMCTIIFWKMLVETKGKTKTEIIANYQRVVYPSPIEETSKSEEKQKTMSKIGTQNELETNRVTARSVTETDVLDKKLSTINLKPRRPKKVFVKNITVL